MDLKDLSSAVIDGDVDAASEITAKLLADGADAEALLNEGLIPALVEVGNLFEQQEYFLPEMVASSAAMKAALAHLRPILTANKVETRGRVLIGTVKGDMHDIGKNLVAAMLEGAGYEIVDLGTDVLPAKFVEMAGDADLICLSALLTTTMPQMKNVIEELKAAGLRDKVKVMVGGAPITADFANEIGADGYAVDASVAVKTANQLLALA
jgi:5-methyltetrahydrofolate--homocysteine methyltransferase